MRYYFYIDYGAGFVLIQMFRNKLKLSWIREFNDFISRKQLTGEVSLQGTEAETAKTYFITNGNYEAPIKIYEHGISGVGTLIYEGWARLKGKYYFSEKVVTLDSFRTDDYYTPMTPLMGISVNANSFINPDVNITENYFTLEGLNANSNKIQGLTYSSPNWSTTGNSLSIPTIGKISATASTVSGEIYVYDNCTAELRTYNYSAPNWTKSANGFLLMTGTLPGNVAIDTYAAGKVAFVDDYLGQIRLYQSGVGTWTLLNTYEAGRSAFKYPDICFVSGTQMAVIDEGTKTLRNISVLSDNPYIFGTPFSMGEIKKPSICQLDSGNSRIAVVDAGTQTIRAMTYASGLWTQTGDSITIGAVNQPSVQFETTNIVNVYDSFTGDLQTYTFSGTAWTATGNSYSIGGGYQGTVVRADPTTWAFIQTDSFRFYSDQTRAYITHLNGLMNSQALGQIYLDGYYLNLTGSGADFDISNTLIGSMKSLTEIDYKSVVKVSNTDKHTLKGALELPELFQNYWYLDFDSTVLGDYQIKFTQPDLFSSFGTDITVATYDSSLAEILNIRDYKEDFLVDKEEINFQNEDGEDFVGELIEYGRNTPVIKSKNYKITTDMLFIQDNYLELAFELQKTGMFLIAGAQGTVQEKFIVEVGTGISGDTNVKNEVMSKARIQDSYWKDYRYADTGNITINGSSSAVQDTVRDIIGFPDVQFSLPNFPTSIASLDWGGGIKSYITNLTTELDTQITTIQSRLLDL